MAALAALLAILLALASLGWSRAAALPAQGTTRLWPPLRRSGQPAAGLIVTSFAFVPQLLPPALMPAVLMVVGLLVGMISIVTQPLLIVTAPVAILAACQATLAVATWWYRRQMHAQILPAVQSLTGLMEGGRTMLVAAFAAVAPTLPEPLGSEWRWVLSRLNLPYTVERADGKVERYTSTHAYALEQLAAQTTVRLHAQVLDQLVAIYEHQLEAQAHQRLTQIAAALARHASLQRSVTTLLGRIRGEAYVITGAFAGILAWLAWSQPERFWLAFAGSEWGLLAAIWFGLWLVLPVVIALLVVRIPDLPL